MATATLPTSEQHTDTFPINGTDYIEFYVGNAKQAAHYYGSAFGFQLLAYRGPETGNRESASYLLQQDKVRLLLTTPIRSDGEIADHVHRHGDGVKDIALWVDDARSAFSLAVERGAKPAREPKVIKDDDGEMVVAAIHTYGDTIHSLVERKNYRGLFMPGFVPKESRHKPALTGLKYVDHCVGNVELGAMMSKVMANGNGRIKFPINEPAEGKKKSQIDEYLEFYNGPGVQHIAIATDDIIATVSALRERGVEFLRVPGTYYDSLLDRVGHIDEDINSLSELGILVDRDDEGYLLQIFTKPVEDRPTLFYEIIERKGAKSFGAGNFKALFEAIEREQALRGNL